MPTHPYPPPSFATPRDVEELRQMVETEFRRISEVFGETQALDLRTVHSEPQKPRPGMIVYADGTDWNPGSGEGAYVYTEDGTWVPLGTGMEVMSANRTFYVRVGGTGLNKGSAKGVDAWGAWQDAIDYVDNNVDDNGFDVFFIQDDTATFPQVYSPANQVSAISISKPLRSGGQRRFVGRDLALGSVDDVVLNCTNTGSGASSAFGAISLRGDCGNNIFQGKFQIRSVNGIGVSNESHGRVINNGEMSFKNCRICVQVNQVQAYFQNNKKIDVETDPLVQLIDTVFRVDSGTLHDNGGPTTPGGTDGGIQVFGNPTIGRFLRVDFFGRGYLGSNVIGAFTGDMVDVRMGGSFDLFGDIGSGAGRTRGNCSPGATVYKLGSPWSQVEGVSLIPAGTNFVDVTFASQTVPDQFNTDYGVLTTGATTTNNTYAVKTSDCAVDKFRITAQNNAAAGGEQVWWRFFWT